MLVAAKALSLLGRPTPWSLWAASAYFWQDALVTLIFGIVDWGVGRKRIGWWAYGILAAYTAANVPLVHLLSTPMTWALWRATGGALSDSIRYHLTWTNLALIGAVASIAAALPLALRYVPNRGFSTALCVLLGLLATGPFAVRQLDTQGRYRTAIVTLFCSALPRVHSRLVRADWRASLFKGAPTENLEAWRGAAAGRNVLLILLESTAAIYLKSYGSRVDPTPHLTDVASHAIVFENAYAVYPESIKELFAILSSSFPPFDRRPDYHPSRHLYLASLLNRVGYRTALFHSGRFAYLGMDDLVHASDFQTLADAGVIGGEVRLLPWVARAARRALEIHLRNRRSAVAIVSLEHRPCRAA